MTYIETLGAAHEHAIERSREAYERAVKAESDSRGFMREGKEYNKHVQCLKALIEEAEGLG